MLNSGPKFFQNIISILPIELTKDERFLKKLVCASVVERLYSKHQILSLVSFASNTHLIIAPSIIMDDANFDKLEMALNECFDYNVINCIKDFVVKKLKPNF